jgi:putative toxin-antitoxin system antitoxin component (TIGR02293 family)
LNRQLSIGYSQIAEGDFVGNVAVRKPDPRRVVESLGIGADEQSQFLQTFLGVSLRTVKRRLAGEAPSKGEQLQLEMLANVNELANQMFGSQENVRRFLTTPLPTFEGKTALQMLDSVQGYERVKSVIIGQAYGMF